MNANSKLGPYIIEGDPNQQTGNGKILEGIIKRHALNVMNGVKQNCSGKIKRRRITSKVSEESIIDFVIVCEAVVEMISEVNIDEERKFVLTRYTKTKKRNRVKESDHNSVITYINTTWNKNKDSNRIEIYSFKDQNGLKKFKEMTSKDNFLSEVFTEAQKVFT